MPCFITINSFCYRPTICCVIGNVKRVQWNVFSFIVVVTVIIIIIISVDRKRKATSYDEDELLVNVGLVKNVGLYMTRKTNRVATC